MNFDWNSILLFRASSMCHWILHSQRIVAPSIHCMQRVPFPQMVELQFDSRSFLLSSWQHFQGKLYIIESCNSSSTIIYRFAIITSNFCEMHKRINLQFNYPLPLLLLLFINIIIIILLLAFNSAFYGKAARVHLFVAASPINYNLKISAIIRWVCNYAIYHHHYWR